MRQSFAWWAFTLANPDLDPVAFLRSARQIGIDGVEMLPDELWPVAGEAGIEQVTITGHDIEVGFNDRSNHAALGDRVSERISSAAANSIPMVIVFSGNRGNVADAEGISACVDGLGPLAERAADAGVTLILELLNSKIDHPDYHCDHSAWGFEVARRVGHPGLRVLFDCYHMQVMEGDLLATMKADLDLIGHIHTAGVPGRRDLDDRQEVNWPGIAGFLGHRGYQGWVGHEFMPRGEPLAALAQAHSLFAEDPR
ncbi:MAG TPA: TIM barrel protein [Acidimicrobiales bacterium]|nr:TIM barrel protein [Acidimicrobiales bacterium]